MVKRKLWLLGVASLGMFSLSVLGADPPGESGDKAGVAAYVDGVAITMQQLDDKALRTNMKLAQQVYDARKAALDQVILERLLAPEAKAKGTTVEKLIEARMAELAPQVTAEDAEAYFNANKARMGNRTLDQVKAQIISFLSSQRDGEAKDKLLAELKSKADVRVVLDAPRTDVVLAANDPTKGPPDAKVTIVEISDFQ